MKLEDRPAEEQLARLYQIMESQRERCRRYKARRYAQDTAFRERQNAKSLAHYYATKGVKTRPEVTWREELEKAFLEISPLLVPKAINYVTDRFLTPDVQPLPSSIEAAMKAFEELQSTRLPEGVRIRQCQLKEMLKVKTPPPAV